MADDDDLATSMADIAGMMKNAGASPPRVPRTVSAYGERSMVNPRQRRGRDYLDLGPRRGPSVPRLTDWKRIAEALAAELDRLGALPENIDALLEPSGDPKQDDVDRAALRWTRITLRSKATPERAADALLATTYDELARLVHENPSTWVLFKPDEWSMYINDNTRQALKRRLPEMTIETKISLARQFGRVLEVRGQPY